MQRLTRSAALATTAPIASPPLAAPTRSPGQKHAPCHSSPDSAFPLIAIAATTSTSATLTAPTAGGGGLWTSSIGRGVINAEVQAHAKEQGDKGIQASATAQTASQLAGAGDTSSQIGGSDVRQGATVEDPDGAEDEGRQVGRQEAFSILQVWDKPLTIYFL